MINEEKLNDQPFAENKKEARRRANKINDPELREIAIMEIDSATTYQELIDLVTEIREHLEDQKRLLKEEEKNDEEMANSSQIQKTEEEKLGDQRFAERKIEARLLATVVVSDPEFKKIFAKRIDLATTEQELDKVSAEMCSHIKGEQLLAKYEEAVELLATVASDPVFREILLKKIDSSDD